MWNQVDGKKKKKAVLSKHASPYVTEGTQKRQIYPKEVGSGC
jgi:hypothetical protein